MRYPIPLIVLITFLSLFLIAWSSWARSPSEQDFQEWLKEHQAWEVLESEINATSPSSPKKILERADLFLKADKPAQALKFLHAQGHFSDPKTEAERLRLMARAARYQNSPRQALLWYSQAAACLPQSDLESFFASEPDLHMFWKSVWRQWFWSRPLLSPGQKAAGGQKRHMLQAAGQARLLWPDDPFWPQAIAVLSPEISLPPSSSQWTKHTLAPHGRTQAAKFMAAISVSNWDVAQGLLNDLDPARRIICTKLLNALHPGQTPGAPRQTSQNFSNYPKMHALRELLPVLSKQMDTERWTIPQPDLPAWPSFENRLLSVSPSKALSLLEKEEQATLLDPNVKQTLSTMARAYSILAGEEDPGSLPQIEKNSPAPLALTLAVHLAGRAESDMPRPTSGPAAHIIAWMGRALGKPEPAPYLLDFWTTIPDPKSFTTAVHDYPLDQLLCYAHDLQTWTDKPSMNLAKECALLYPHTPLAARGLLYLARHANTQGRTDVAWTYLKLIDPAGLPPEVHSKYLLAKAGLEMETGQEDASLQTYQRLLRESPDKIPADRKLKLAVLGQRRGQWKWAQNLLQDLLETRDEELSPALRAEALFWLGEGAQHMQHLDRALNHYLRLAWEFPDQHIWAITAMYRAALIYERKGRLQTAKSLLEKVCDQADRKSQKEAAKDRIKAIERKLGASDDTTGAGPLL